MIDFAHMHATSDGAYVDVGIFAEALTRADAVLEDGAPFHIHFSDIAYANGTRLSTSPTARARCAPSRLRRLWRASSGRQR